MLLRQPDDNCSPSTRDPLGAESVHTCVCTNAKELKAAPSLQRRIRMRTPGASCLTRSGFVNCLHAIDETLSIVSTNVRTQTSTTYRSGRAPTRVGSSHELARPLQTDRSHPSNPCPVSCHVMSIASCHSPINRRANTSGGSCRTVRSAVRPSDINRRVLTSFGLVFSVRGAISTARY